MHADRSLLWRLRWTAILCTAALMVFFSTFSIYSRTPPVEVVHFPACLNGSGKEHELDGSSLASSLSTIPVSSPHIWDYGNWPIPPLEIFSAQIKCDDALLTDFSLADTLEVQEIIFKHQNPVGCNSSKFLIMSNHWNAGFGSSMHVRGDMLLHALSVGRVFLNIADNDERWDFAPSHCLSASPECYFLRLSNCTLPADWRSKSKLITYPHPFPNETNTLPRYIHRRFNMTYGGPYDMSLFSSKYAHKPYHWWMVQAMRYTLRFRPFVLTEVLEPYQHAAFAHAPVSVCAFVH